MRLPDGRRLYTAPCENVRHQFTSSMTNILNRHRSVVELVAYGVMEYKGARTIEEEKIQYFLDRFYISRIAIRFLINQHGKKFVLASSKAFSCGPTRTVRCILVHS